MSSLNHNIKFVYLYRDGGNYKQHNEIIFSNPNQRPLAEVEKIIRKNLIDNSWFVAKDWNIPDMHFKNYNWDNKIDHDWHEFDRLEETNGITFEPETIEDFLSKINRVTAKFISGY